MSGAIIFPNGNSCADFFSALFSTIRNPVNSFQAAGSDFHSVKF
jgi:hypothetical protein